MYWTCAPHVVCYDAFDCGNSFIRDVLGVCLLAFLQGSVNVSNAVGQYIMSRLPHPPNLLLLHFADDILMEHVVASYVALQFSSEETLAVKTRLW